MDALATTARVEEPSSALISSAPAAPLPAPPPTPTAPLPPPQASPVLASAAASEFLAAWPRSAQIATAVLLLLTGGLLAWQALNNARRGARPAELTRGGVLHYRVDVNHASAAELMQLPGIGPALAERIVVHRTQQGGFKTIGQLTLVQGIGPATFDRLRPWVTLATDGDEGEAETALVPAPVQGKAQTKKAALLKEAIDINEATQADLQKLPGIGPKMSQRILDERQKRPFAAVDELRRVAGIGPKTMENVRPYVTVGGNGQGPK